MRTTASPLPQLPCLCATARRAARALTQFYDRYLRDGGIEASQFTLLTVLRENPGRAQNDIARMLAFDKTTLSRNLKLLERKGWIALAPSTDRRRRAFAVTSDGKRQLKIAAPHWQKAQLQVRSRLKNREWHAAWKVLAALTEASRDATRENSFVR